MSSKSFIPLLGLTLMTCTLCGVHAGQAPALASAPDIPISAADRVYTADQFSNTVSVIDPSSNRLLGVIRLGDPQPANLSPLYPGQVLVHGLGFSPDHKTLAVVSILTNSVTFIDTRTNQVLHTSYVGRAPHEAFFSPDNREVWVSVRGQNYIQVLDGKTFDHKDRIELPNGPGMTIFSPDGTYAYVCSSFTPETDVFDVKTHRLAGKVKQPSPFCPNIAASPDGRQVWLTLKDSGKVEVFDAKPPFNIISVMETGPITNHVNFIKNNEGVYAYVTIGGLNQVKVFDTKNLKQIANIPVGALPHGIWPSGDGNRIYVGLENDDKVAVIDTQHHALITTIQVGQAPQALVYVPQASPAGVDSSNLQPLGLAGQVAQIKLGAFGGDGHALTQVTLFDQGLTQVLQAAVTGLKPGSAYTLNLVDSQNGQGDVQPLTHFKTNGSGSAIVNAFGPIRQSLSPSVAEERRYLEITDDSIAPGVGKPAQIQL